MAHKRKFNGKTYHLLYTLPYGQAVDKAKELRKKGYLVRVVPWKTRPFEPIERRALFVKPSKKKNRRKS